MKPYQGLNYFLGFVGLLHWEGWVPLDSHEPKKKPADFKQIWCQDFKQTSFPSMLPLLPFLRDLASLMVSGAEKHSKGPISNRGWGNMIDEVVKISLRCDVKCIYLKLLSLVEVKCHMFYKDTFEVSYLCRSYNDRRPQV